MGITACTAHRCRRRPLMTRPPGRALQRVSPVPRVPPVSREAIMTDRQSADPREPRPAPEPPTRPGQRPIEDPPDSGPVVPTPPASPPAQEPPTRPGTAPIEDPQTEPDTV